jgi:hypothetical protein
MRSLRFKVIFGRLLTPTLDLVHDGVHSERGKIKSRRALRRSGHFEARQSSRQGWNFAANAFAQRPGIEEEMAAAVKFVHLNKSIKGWSSYSTTKKRVSFLGALLPA